MARRPERMPIKDAVSAGGVVCRLGETGVEVVICGRTSEGLWGLPKGTPEPNETLEQTAAREVEEETGLKVAIEDKVGEITYWFTRDGVRYHKVVYYYLMRPVSGDVSAHDWEYDRVEWMSSVTALRTLTFENDREMVRRAEQLLRAQADQFRQHEVSP